MRLGFLDSFLDEQNNIYSQCLKFNFSLKLAYFLKRHYIGPHLMKCNLNLHAVTAESYPLEMNTCSVVRVYFPPQLIRILHTKRFLVHNLKGKPKNLREIQKYCSICNYITYGRRFLYRKQPCLFING